MNWIIPCNVEKYDVFSAFEKGRIIDWKQSANFSVGDTVFIYVSSPFKAISFQCLVVQTDLKELELVNHVDVKDGTSYLDNGRYMRLKLVKRIKNKQLTFQKMIQNGLNGNIQGPIKMNMKLSSYFVSVLLRR